MRRLRRPALLALAALAPLAVSCADAPRDPVALLVTPEARAAIEVGSTLPGLPELAHRARATGAAAGDLARAELLWRQAQDAGDADAARALRESAYAAAAPALAAGLDSAALAGAQGRLQQWIQLAGGALRHAEVPELSRALSESEAYLQEARAAQARHDAAAAVVGTLRASDRLAETTPQGVAARLSAQNEAALEGMRHVAGRPVSDEARRRLDRISRLVRGSREALAAGHYETAIRRGYYARQLLEAEGALARAQNE